MAVYHNLGHGCINDSDRQRRRRVTGELEIAEGHSSTAGYERLLNGKHEKRLHRRYFN